MARSLLKYAQEMGCRTCASPGGGCQFLGTAATSQVVAEALGLALPHSALAPSGQPIWRDMARRSARAVLHLRPWNDDAGDRHRRGDPQRHGGSRRFRRIDESAPACPGHRLRRRASPADGGGLGGDQPQGAAACRCAAERAGRAPTVRVFLAGGVPEVMLHLRDLGLLELEAMTATGEPLGAVLDWWEVVRAPFPAAASCCAQSDGVEPGEVIMSPERARERGLTSTVTFPRGNLAPEGSVVKSTAIDPRVIDADGVYRKTGPARVFLTRNRGRSRPSRTGRYRPETCWF